MTANPSIPRALLVAAALTASPAAAKNRHVDLSPYIAVGQVLSADLDGGSANDVLTYTSVAAGIDGTIQTRRAQVQISYQYERRISETRGVGDDDVHSGIARANIAVVPGSSLEAGAVATRTRAAARGVRPDGQPGRLANISKVYSAYAGPTLATHLGPVAVGAGYKYGYTKATAPGVTGVPGGQPRLDAYDEAHSHSAQVSAGVRSGTVLPIGVNVSAGYQREDAGQLDQRYEGRFARGDVVLPVAPTLAVTAGAGYEKIEISQRDAVLGAGGVPVVDARGRQVTDEASPRRLTYLTDGMIWDAGVVWRPSPRTTLQARVGHRYDSMTYTGSLSYQPSARMGLNIGVYDGIESFGRQLTSQLASLPTSFNTGDDPFDVQNGGGCAFGTSGESGGAAGGCLNGALQSVTTANFRSRGVDGVLSVNAGPTSFGVGAGYANRRYFAPSSGYNSVLNGIEDQSYYFQLFASQRLGPNSGVDGNVFVNYLDSGLPGAPNTLGGGATGSYHYNWGRLGTTASLGVYAFDQEGTSSDVTAQALLGMSYRF